MHWLTAIRIRSYSVIFIIMFLLASLFLVWRSETTVGKVLNPGNDFGVFWAASYLGLKGRVHEIPQIQSFCDHDTVPVPTRLCGFPWLYPPAYYVVVFPLALEPFWISYWIFMISTLSGFAIGIRKIIRGSAGALSLAAFPGVWATVLAGQNGFLTAALAGFALHSLPRKPILAGTLAGFLAMKPQLAVLFPVALIAIRAWSALVAFSAAFVAMMGLGTFMMEPEALDAWMGRIGYVQGAISHDGSSFDTWAKMPTVFALFRSLGVAPSIALDLHAMSAAFAGLLVWKVWKTCKSMPVRSATLMTASLLASPYLFYYDLVWLAFPIAWLVQEALKSGWRTGEREILLVSWLLPLGTLFFSSLARFQVAPIVIWTLFLMLAGRASPKRSVNQ
jgi:hypothetical protein